MSAGGVLCSECPAYLARVKGTAHQRRTVRTWRRIYGLAETGEHISCGGCFGPDEEVFHTSRTSLWDDVPKLAGMLSAADFVTYARPYCGHRERLAAARAPGGMAGDQGAQVRLGNAPATASN